MFDTYLVKKGDTLDSISRKYNVSKSYLIDINNIFFEDDIKEGRELIVPKVEDVYFDTYVIEKGDTLYAISRRYNVNPELLSAVNGINKEDYIYPGQKIMIPKSGYSYYITADGDTLDIVKNAFNTTYDKLLDENKTVYLMPEQLIVLKK
ncbi:MAG: LysM peptidoglycan-binding domain-containing protein [Bacilli bacterium]|nr:LysM peptidoglycan-binding domain-containing protein [Bacilli bacterium]